MDRSKHFLCQPKQHFPVESDMHHVLLLPLEHDVLQKHVPDVLHGPNHWQMYRQDHLDEADVLQLWDVPQTPWIYQLTKRHHRSMWRIPVKAVQLGEPPISVKRWLWLQRLQHSARQLWDAPHVNLVRRGEGHMLLMRGIQRWENQSNLHPQCQFSRFSL